MSEGGAALMAVSSASGEERAREAAEKAISSQLLDITIDGARGILLNVTGGPDLTLYEVNQSAAIIKETAHPDVNLIFGAVIDPNIKDEIRITVIATGFERTGVPRSVMNPVPLRSESMRPENLRPDASRPETRSAQQFSSYGQQSTQRPAEPKDYATVNSQPDFAPRTFNTEDLDIPPFLRGKRSR
jgi:cell division protein FtsZ